MGSIVLSFFMIMYSSSYAIPAFARKYSMSCTTCHAPIPRLKAYGDEFAGNGFEFENQQATRYTMKDGDERLELLRTFPLAARFDGFIKYDSKTNKDMDFSSPYNLKILSGGSLGKNIAYYFYFFLSERGEVAGVEDAYIMFNNLFKQDFDIYLGQFQVSDPLFKRELRLTYEDYMMYKQPIFDSRITLAYDRGIMMTWGIANGPDIIFEILNGNGIGEADEMRTYDDDKYKTFAGRISYDVSENIRIGGFAYFGKEQAEAINVAETDTTMSDNEATYFGPDMTLAVEKLELNLQYLYRKDDNPKFDYSTPENNVETTGGFAELIYWPNGDKSKWYLVGLYNHIDQDLGNGTGKNTTYQTFTGHIGYVLQTNLRLIVENTYDIENKENRVVLGFVSGF
ncbi:MAG: hypothetical protein DWP97_14175 [Calditrichaeota bacterium]|nr:MAG: hypothetical protein DWP97_14175 [Calditrichota bacterium]